MIDYANPLTPIVAAWVEKIQAALAFKKKRFQLEADEGMRFFSGPYDFFFDSLRTDKYFRVPGQRLSDGSITVTINKVSEMVQIFGPALYHANPVREVTPRAYPQLPAAAFADVADPAAMQMLQQAYVLSEQTRMDDEVRSLLFGSLMNWTPSALDHKTHSRRAIDEALIKGLGLTWCETFTPPGSSVKMVGEFFDTVDNLVLDPDAKTIDGGNWIARKCCHPVWEVEREYGLPPGYLKPMMMSTSQWAAVAASDIGPTYGPVGENNDLLVYWKVYSKMGLGGRLPRIAGGDPALREVSDHFGDFCYLVIAANCPHPLNMPPWLTNAPGGMEKARQACQWPTPFWADGGWPFIPYYFHEIPGDPWPQSHLAPALGELKFLNWMYQKMVSKIKTTSRDLIACKEDAEQAVKDAIENGEDLEIIPLQSMDGKTISELIQFVQHPEWNQDFWTVIEAVTQQFEQRTGLTELAYGQSARQYRSAAEAEIKQQGVSVRPDDMANKVEDAESLACRRELFASYWHLAPADVLPVLGELGALAWANKVYTADPRSVIYNLWARVEAGSARKPNKERTKDDMNTAVQNLGQMLYGYAKATGNTNPLNALIEDWGKSMDLRTVHRYMLPAMPPPMPADAEGGSSGGGSAAA